MAEVGSKKRVRSRTGRPRLTHYVRHLSGEEAVGGVPGTASGEAGWCRWIALDLDEAEWDALGPVVSEWWSQGIYAYPSRGLTRGWRLWLFLSRPVSQGRAFRIAKRLREILEAKGLGPVEAFPSSPEPGRGQKTLIPYYGGRNPLLHPLTLEPIPPSALRRLKRVRVTRLGLSRKHLAALAEEVRTARPGERHDKLLRAALKAFSLGLPEGEVESSLRAAAAEAGLPEEEDPQEVDRILSWAKRQAAARKRPRRTKPKLLPPDLKNPLFRGRRGLSLYLLLTSIWKLYTEYGYEEDGVPKIQASYRQLAELAGLSLDTTRRHLKLLKEIGVLEGTWCKEPDQGTVWTLHLERWPGGDGEPALTPRPAWSWSALGPSAGAVYEGAKAGLSVGEIARATGLHRETVRRALKRLRAHLGEANWDEALEAYEEAFAKPLWEKRRKEHALERARWLEKWGEKERTPIQATAPPAA